MKALNKKRQQRIVIWGIVLVLLLVFSLAVLVAYSRDMQIADRMIRNRAKIMETPIGTLEYLTYGAGKPILISHGAGGGFNQGILIAKILGPGYRFIIPSRFGYLRSQTGLPVTARLQAEAYAFILKDAGIPRAAVAAISAGGRSALSFASHYPGICEELIMISAISAPLVNSQADDLKTAAFAWLFKSDFIYWSVTKLFRPQVMALFGLTRDDQQRLGARDKKWLAEFLYTTMPVSRLEKGVLNDQRIAAPSTREVEAIKAPTLILHVKQDPLISFRNAEYTHRHIPGSQLIAFERGGHFLMGHHREIAAKVRAFLYHD